MSRLIISPALNDEQKVKFCNMILEYSNQYTCAHILENVVKDQWVTIQLVTAKDCKRCIEEYQTKIQNWIHGSFEMFDHNVLRHIITISDNFPTTVFKGYSVGCEWEGCRLDRYIIQNGKQLSLHITYLEEDLPDWSIDYDSIFDQEVNCIVRKLQEQ